MCSWLRSAWPRCQYLATGVAPASSPRPPGATSDGTLALRSAYIHPHNFVPFVEERNDEQHHRRVATQGCTSRGILLPAHLRDRGRGELWYQRAPDGRRRERLFRIGIASNLVYEAGLLV